jgi:hypothetical protein
MLFKPNGTNGGKKPANDVPSTTIYQRAYKPSFFMQLNQNHLVQNFPTIRKSE